ncbi:ribosomal protein S6 kinase alpha-5-like [Rhinophrynus dorsalis]
MGSCVAHELEPSHLQQSYLDTGKRTSSLLRLNHLILKPLTSEYQENTKKVSALCAQGGINMEASRCEEEQTGYPMFGIKRFKFYQELGRGAFGKVMLAQDTVIGDLLAMKVVKKSKYVTHPDSAMMERRILALANDCPFLTHSRCAFQTQEHLIYAMEFVSGGTLRQYIKRNKSLSISMTQDLKTDNILVDRNGHIKIADFGLAIEDLYEDEETVGFAGTVGYAAPEMLGDYYYNSSVDWWSLGIIIFEMATGETPFWGEDCESLIKDVEALVYPDFFSHEMTDLLQKLWTIDQVLRLELAQDILSHPFFNDIEWEDLELQLTAPPVRPSNSQLKYHQSYLDTGKRTSSLLRFNHLILKPLTSEYQENTKKVRALCAQGGINMEASRCEEEQTGYPMFGIKRFKFYQELGRGAFGKVMLAQDTVIGDLLAMKVVKKSKYVTHPDSAMMERRILALANDCPFLTHSRCAFQTQEHLIYAMEFVSGGTLRQYIKRNKSLSISMTQDLKTDNILVDRNGHIKIADFGLAIEDLYEDEETVGFAGTVGYAAPEMLGDYYYNSSVDWWSLGIIIFEMATGETPFWGEDCESLIKDVEALVYPDFFSHEMTDLLQKLWTIDQVLRLELAQDILSHPFFNDIEWEDLELQLTAPPVRPDPTYTLSRLECLLMSQGSNVSSSEEQNTPLSPQDQALFSGFSFVHPNWN